MKLAFDRVWKLIEKKLMTTEGPSKGDIRWAATVDGLIDAINEQEEGVPEKESDHINGARVLALRAAEMIESDPSCTCERIDVENGLWKATIVGRLSPEPLRPKKSVLGRATELDIMEKIEEFQSAWLKTHSCDPSVANGYFIELTSEEEAILTNTFRGYRSYPFSGYITRIGYIPIRKKK